MADNAYLDGAGVAQLWQATKDYADQPNHITDAMLAQEGGVIDSIKRIDKSIDYLQLLTVGVVRPTITGAGATAGVSVAKNADGTITVSGTTTDYINRTVGTFTPEIGKTYIFETGVAPSANAYWYLTGVNGSSEWQRVGYTWKCTSINTINLKFYATPDTAISETFYLVIRELNTNTALAETIDSVITVTDHSGTMELGNINGAQMWWTSSTSRVRTMQEKPIKLRAGDSIYLTDYSDATYYVIWRAVDGTTGNRGWLTDAYTATVDGDYWVLMRNKSEATITDIRTLMNLLRIKKHVGFEDYIKDATPVIQRTDWHIRSINHRGYGRIAPENTLPAFVLSAQLGWPCVETDVRFTSDGVAVLLHDETINRTARNVDGSELSGTINIGDITYEQALTYDFGVWMGEQYAGTEIPTLAEFCKLCKKLSLDMYIEIKDETGTRVKQVVDIVRRCGMMNHASFIAFSYTALEKVTAEQADARIGLILGNDVDANAISILDSISNGSNDVFASCNFSSLTASGADLMCAAGYPLEVYTPNVIAWMNETMDEYVTGVTSDWFIAGKELYKANI